MDYQQPYGSSTGSSMDNQNTFSTQTVIGTSDTEVSFSIIELLPGTTYYYRLAARNDTGTTYGDEVSFTTDMKASHTTDITLLLQFLSEISKYSSWSLWQKQRIFPETLMHA